MSKKKMKKMKMSVLQIVSIFFCYEKCLCQQKKYENVPFDIGYQPIKFQ